MRSSGAAPNARERASSMLRLTAVLKHGLDLDGALLVAKARSGTREERLLRLGEVDTQILVSDVKYGWSIRRMLLGSIRNIRARARVTLGQTWHRCKDTVVGISVLEGLQTSDLFFGIDGGHAAGHHRNGLQRLNGDDDLLRLSVGGDCGWSLYGKGGSPDGIASIDPAVGSVLRFVANLVDALETPVEVRELLGSE